MAKTPWLPLKNPVLEHRGLCAKATATMDLDSQMGPKCVGAIHDGAPAFSDDPCIVAKPPRKNQLDKWLGTTATGAQAQAGCGVCTHACASVLQASNACLWIIQYNILPWRQFSRAIGKLATQKRTVVFFVLSRWGPSTTTSISSATSSQISSLPDGLKTKRSMTFLLTKDTFSDARCVEDKGNFVLKIKQSKTGSACTHDVVFQTRWSSSKGVMLFSISSGLARASRGRLLARERKRCAHRLLRASRLCQAYQLIRSSTVWLRVA